MYVKPFLLAAGFLAVAGCAGNVTIPPPGPDHPANPQAAAAPRPPSPAIPAGNNTVEGMPGMDHGSMKSMSQESMPGMNHGSMRGMDHGTMKDAPKPGDTEEPTTKKDADGMEGVHHEH